LRVIVAVDISRICSPHRDIFTPVKKRRPTKNTGHDLFFDIGHEIVWQTGCFSEVKDIVSQCPRLKIFRCPLSYVAYIQKETFTVQTNNNKKSPELGQSCTAFLDTMNLYHWPAPE
jgi:hypothetical protein